MTNPSFNEESDKNLGLIFRIPSAFAFLILLSSLFVPYVLFLSLGSLWGLTGALVIGIYLKIRYPSRGFGPMFLTMFDMGIIFGNGILILSALIHYGDNKKYRTRRCT